MKCPACGKENPDSSKFCDECGGALVPSPDQSQETPQPPTADVAHDDATTAATTATGSDASSSGASPFSAPDAQTTPFPGTTAQTPVAPPAANVPPASASTPTDDGFGLSLAGLILAFFFQLVGLILSIIGFNKANKLKKAGYYRDRVKTSYTLGLVGIILNAVFMFLVVIVLALVGLGFWAVLSDGTLSTEVNNAIQSSQSGTASTTLGTSSTSAATSAATSTSATTTTGETRTTLAAISDQTTEALIGFVDLNGQETDVLFDVTVTPASGTTGTITLTPYSIYESDNADASVGSYTAYSGPCTFNSSQYTLTFSAALTSGGMTIPYEFDFDSTLGDPDSYSATCTVNNASSYGFSSIEALLG